MLGNDRFKQRIQQKLDRRAEPKAKGGDRKSEKPGLAQSDPIDFGETSNRSNFQKDVFYEATQALGDRARPTNGSDCGSLRDHNLTLFVSTGQTRLPRINQVADLSTLSLRVSPTCTLVQYLNIAGRYRFWM